MKRLMILFLMSQWVVSAWAIEKTGPVAPWVQHTSQLIQSVAKSKLEPTKTRAGFGQEPTIQQTGTITGQVFNLADSAWESAFIKAFTADSLTGGPDPIELIVPVDPEGHYRIDGVPVGSYYIFAAAKGYEALFYRDASDINEAELLQVTEDQEITGIDFRMRI